MINKIHPGTILPLGFALILVLVLTVTGYAINQLNTLTTEVEQVEEDNHQKIKLTQDMRQLILLRSQTLSHVLMLDDFFARDEESQRFYSLARDYIGKRERLINLLKKDGDFALIDRIRGRSQVTVSTIEAAMRLAVERDPDVDIAPYAQAAFSTFRTNFNTINEIVLLLEENNREWQKDWAARNEHAQNTLLLLGGGVMFLGLLIAVVVIRRDREHNSRLQEESRERLASEVRFKDFAEVASDWFWEMDEQLQFSYFSGQNFAITGLDPLHLMGKTRQEMSAELIDNPKWIKHFNDLDAHMPFYNFEYDLETGDGKTICISINGKPVFDDFGKFLGYRGCGSDITASVMTEMALRNGRDSLDREIHERTHQLRQEIEERKQIQRELSYAKDRAEVANLTKSQFLANMSHELRSPLNAIIGFSDAIDSKLYGPLGDPKYDEYIINIRESGRHLLELINDILDLSVVEAGKLELSQDTVDIQRAIDSMVNMVRTRTIDKHQKMTFKVAEDIPQVSADERRVKQILINLATNAMKFTPEGGEIKTTAGLDDEGCVFVSISDTGIGMSEQETKVAMSSFGQVNGSSTQTHEGTGLGLPLVKSLMAAHGGDLKIISTPGKGTTATIRFPKKLIVT